MKIPHIEERNGTKILMVDEKPFIMISGEVHNSNSSSVEYMEQVWEKAETLGMNSLLMPVTWEMVEPEEGRFDFSLVDGLIRQAERKGKKIGFLWFGAWKNAQCYYAPEWVKTDLERFRRAEVEKGKKFVNLKEFYGMSYTSLSYMCEATKEADAKAFRELMEHIREADGETHTVVMVQVENETGVMGAAREHSDEADAAFESQVPQDFAEYMRNHTDTMKEDVREAVLKGTASGNWSEVFTDAAEEIFSAYHIASYVNYVAGAGKAVYPLPMSVNCWLDKGEAPGKYPSGGPVARMMEVWKYCAPNIDIYAPDIYTQNFIEVCEEYRKLGNPMFIPETATHGYCGARQVYVVGHHHAMCYSPFGFEELGEPFSAQSMYLFGADTTDPALATPQDVEQYAWYSNTLKEMMPLLGAKYGTCDLKAVCSEVDGEKSLLFDKFGFRIVTESRMMQLKMGAALILKESEDTFYLLLNGVAMVPFSTDPKNPYLDILKLEEGKFEDGVWKMKRRLNGDEVAAMCYEKPALLKMKLFAYH